jgi:flagellar motor switch protein FliG
MKLKLEDLRPMQKSAIALVAFGSEISGMILKSMPEQDVEKITVEIANLGDVPPDIEEKVVDECYQIFMARQYITQGGIDLASEILEKAMGHKKAREIMSRLESSFRTSGFNLLKDIDARQLTSYMQNEHPQTIALILTQMSPPQSASVLSELPSELQAEVALRIATMEKISPDVIKEIESNLEGHFASEGSVNLSISGCATTMADRSIQRLLKEVETKDLSISLKAASDEVREKIYTNVSERVAVMIKEEMEFMGPMRLSDVEAAQQRIVEAVRQLEEEGQIVISGRGGKEDVIV